MKSLKRFKERGKSQRDYRAFMIDLLNLMSMAYAVELHESHGFGADRLSSVTDGAIKRIHSAVYRYEKEFADMALIDWCRRIGFDWRIGLDEKYAIKFIGGKVKKK